MDSLTQGTIEYRGKKWTAIKMGRYYSIFQNKIQKNNLSEDTPDTLRTSRTDPTRNLRIVIPAVLITSTAELATACAIHHSVLTLPKDPLLLPTTTRAQTLPRL